MNLKATPSAPPKQQGFALMTVLLIVSLVTIIASQMIYQQALDTQRTENRVHQAQSNAVMLGLTSWIKKGLKLDAELNDTDHLEEEWAKPMPPIPFANGEVSGQLFDLQGALNVNNLQTTDNAQQAFWQAIFKRFFEKQQSIDATTNAIAVSPLTVDFTAVISDWLDADNETREGGAESDFYGLKQPAYRASNRKLVVDSELLLLKGVTYDRLEAWKGLLATLPENNTRLNVNTMPQPVLAVISDWMTNEIAQGWIETRKVSPANDLSEFREFLVKQSGLTKEEVSNDIKEDFFTVQTQYFLLNGFVSYGESQQAVNGLFYRQNKDNVTLIQRWLSPI